MPRPVTFAKTYSLYLRAVTLHENIQANLVAQDNNGRLSFFIQIDRGPLHKNLLRSLLSTYRVIAVGHVAKQHRSLHGAVSMVACT